MVRAFFLTTNLMRLIYFQFPYHLRMETRTSGYKQKRLIDKSAPKKRIYLFITVTKAQNIYLNIHSNNKHLTFSFLPDARFNFLRRRCPIRALSANMIWCVHGGVQATDATELSPFQTQLHNTQIESELSEDASLSSVTPIDEFGPLDSRTD